MEEKNKQKNGKRNGKKPIPTRFSTCACEFRVMGKFKKWNRYNWKNCKTANRKKVTDEKTDDEEQKQESVEISEAGITPV